MLRFNVGQLKRELEVRQGRDISWREIAHETGLFYDTLLRIDQRTRADLDTMKKLVEYFRAQGMDVSIDDLFEEVSAR